LENRLLGALGKEVGLEIDQTLKIESENLEIKFLGGDFRF
jgi:hypothetical protein